MDVAVVVSTLAGVTHRVGEFAEILDGILSNELTGIQTDEGLKSGLKFTFFMLHKIL